MTHLALLRGINVSGQKLIKMEDLRKRLAEAGFQNVQTYIQSGNIILESALSGAKVGGIIKSVIEKGYGFDVDILMLDQRKLQRAFDDNPFVKAGCDVKKTYVAFLSDEPANENVKKLEASDFGADRWSLSGDVLYLCYDTGAGSTKLTNKVIESKLKVTATSRNWNTTGKLLEMLAR